MQCNMDPEFFVKFSDILFERSVAGDNGQCRMWVGCADKYGYGRIWANGRNMGAHRLAFIVHNKVKHIEELKGKHVSHLRHNKLCINTAHLSLEDQETNNQRRTCVTAKHCLGHPGFKECLLTLRELLHAIMLRLLAITKRKARSTLEMCLG